MHGPAIHKCLDSIHYNQVRLEGDIYLCDHLSLMGRTMKLLHVIISIPVCGHHPHMEFQGHGKHASILVRLNTACRDKTLSIQDRACNVKPILPVGVLGCDLYPVLIPEFVEIDDLDIQFFHEGQDTFILHDLPGGGIASFSKTDALCTHLPDRLDECHQGIVVG